MDPLVSEANGGDLPRGVSQYQRQRRNPNLEGIEERLAAIDAKRKAEEEANDARWKFYYEQLAKHAPFGGSEKGGGRTYRWD